MDGAKSGNPRGQVGLSRVGDWSSGHDGVQTAWMGGGWRRLETRLRDSVNGVKQERRFWKWMGLMEKVWNSPHGG